MEEAYVNLKRMPQDTTLIVLLILINKKKNQLIDFGWLLVPSRTKMVNMIIKYNLCNAVKTFV